MNHPKVTTAHDPEEGRGEKATTGGKECLSTKGEEKDGEDAPDVSDLLDAAKEIEEGLRSTFGVKKEETNFTWAHYFETHCGVLQKDALEYEKHLIAHRLNPEDTLLESLGLIIEYGRIPIGDKLKITKAIERQSEALDREDKCEQEATKALGLEKYTTFEAGMIMDFAGGKTDEWAIDYGIEMLEEAMEEIKKASAIAILRNPKAKEMYNAGAEAGRQMKDPVLRLLRSLGYTTFDYTKNKTVEPGRPQTQLASDVADLLLGNLDGTGQREREDRAASINAMYT